MCANEEHKMSIGFDMRTKEKCMNARGNLHFEQKRKDM